MKLPIKQLAVLFWVAVAGIVVSLGGTIYAGIQQHRAKVAEENAPRTLPLPADAQTSGAQNAPVQPGQPAPMRPAEPTQQR